MRKKKVSKLKLVFLLFLSFIAFALMLLNIYILFIYDSGGDVLNVETINIVNSCDNLNIFKSAECVKSYVKEFYYYNITNIGKDLTFQQLKEEGGVCEHWAKLYCSIGESLGFYTKEVTILTDKTNMTINGKTESRIIQHMFCVWSDKEGYVVLDQRTGFDFGFGDLNENNN